MSQPTIRSVSENLVQYLRDNSSLEIIDAGWFPSDQENAILVRETGGSQRRWPDNRQDADIQIISRAGDEFTAKEQAFEIWNLLRQEQYGVTLPAPTIITGAADVLAEKIDLVNRPYPLGAYNSSYEYVFTVTITYFAN